MMKTEKATVLSGNSNIKNQKYFVTSFKRKFDLILLFL